MLVLAEEGRAEAPPSSVAGADYRFDVPREAFLIFFLCSPRAQVRAVFGAAFLRAARLSCLRSVRSVTLEVFAICVPFRTRSLGEPTVATMRLSQRRRRPPVT